MFRETIYFYGSQILRLETLSMRTGKNKSELMRYVLEAFLRHFGLEDPDFKMLPDDVEQEMVVEYEERMMRPFDRVLMEST
jgi:hypothetical protein